MNKNRTIIKVLLIGTCVIIIVALIYFNIIKKNNQSKYVNNTTINFQEENNLNNSVTNDYIINNNLSTGNEFITNTDANLSNDKNEKFYMKIKDVFKITGRGTVVTGKVESGTIKVNDTVQIIGENNEIKTTVITDIERFKKNDGEVEVGENVGLFLKDIEKEDVKEGQIVQSVD
ncbi:MAG: hypothetical protein ILA02_04005 [Clostridia bacterium]|nr:hypothetical protein [Clostridia bacterium]